MATSEALPAGPLADDELRLIDALVARRQLPLGRPDLPARQPAAARAARGRARQAAPARPLGHHARPQPPLRPPQPRHPRARPRRDLRRPGPGHGGPGVVANAYLEGTYSELYPQVGRDEDGLQRAVPPVLVPGRHPEPRRARDAGLDPRGRRARLRARARLRRGLRQPRPGRRLRRRRRRGRDRAARGELALEQVPQPRARRRRAADPAPQRLQDRQPDRARAHPRGRAASRCSTGYGWRPLSSPAVDEPTAACTSSSRRRSTRRSTRSREIQRGARATARRRAPALADDRAAHAEGLDRPEGGRRPAGRGHLALAPGAARGRARRTPSTCELLEELAAQLPARGALRRRRRARRPSSRRSRRRASAA